MTDSSNTDHMSQVDPRGLIREAYRMEGLDAGQYRTIFLDWALGLPAGGDDKAMIEAVLALYAEGHEAHPMTIVLREGLQSATRTGRRGGRAARQR
ncbi:MAG: hypothetical protein ACWA47_12845 [Brevirhabdus sp.]